MKLTMEQPRFLSCWEKGRISRQDIACAISVKKQVIQPTRIL